MKRLKANRLHRSFIWFTGAALCLGSLVGAPIVGSHLPFDLGWNRKADPESQKILKEMDRLGILEDAPNGVVSSLLDYQKGTGKSLAQILREPNWVRKLNLSAKTFKATWYISNPFDVLPPDIQRAIKKRKIPFRSRTHVWQWCRKNRVPKKWRRALYAALIETTPHNLWRASRGRRPYTKNGEFLEPIVVDHGEGVFEVRDGHIATDPRVIPTNSEVLLLVRIQGEDRILRVKATDVGGAIKGRHIDLPIHVGPESLPFPHTRLPKEHIRNRIVEVIKVFPPNPSQKA